MVQEEAEALFPEGTDVDRAQYEWGSFKMLLRAKGTYTPELIQEYLLDGLIAFALDMDKDSDPAPVLHLASARFPEPERAALVQDLGEEEVALYENLHNYKSTLFWDEDFMFLDDMTEDQLDRSPMAEEMGIGSPNQMVIDVYGKEVTIKARPWELEETT